VAYAAVGDPTWPMPGHLRAVFPAGAVVAQHRIVHDVQRPDEALLADMHRKLRAHLRRTGRNGVSVAEITTEAELGEFFALGAETADRIRTRKLVAAMPDEFFVPIFRTMVPRGDALFLLARGHGRPLAGALFLKLGSSLTYYHGVSTRDPALVSFQGPSAMFWHAMRYARGAGLRSFDHGAVTLTDDTSHPNYSVLEYKRRFGGRVEEIATAHVVLSPMRHAFQERVLMPLWKRLYPLYMRARRAAPAPAA
jgi:lipid II:glycine glycyltransferase (peptidoglycan interpeptide bridge formation enzyme)